MKVALFLSAIAGASAFAPASQPARAASQLSASADLEGLRGIGPETGGQIVSSNTADNNINNDDSINSNRLTEYHRLCFQNSLILSSWQNGLLLITSERLNWPTDVRPCWLPSDGSSPSWLEPLRDPLTPSTPSKPSSSLMLNGGPNSSFSALLLRESSTVEKWKESPSLEKSARKLLWTGPTTGARY